MAVMLITASFTMPSYVFADGNTGDYASMIQYFQQKMKNRENNISYTFVTTDSTYADKYNNKVAAVDLGNELYRDIFFDIFTKQYTNTPDPYLGDYLYNSINNEANTVDWDYTIRHENEQAVYTFKIEFNFNYYTSKEEEELIDSFADSFTRNYLSDSMTEYQKVKTIYDFVVRNATYDHAVFNNEFNELDARFKRSHSAYGAIYGSLIKDNKGIDEYDSSYKTILSGEKIIKTPNQGLAVCEGYSKLFYILCMKQGIPCRIVDGDNTEQSGNGHDPHEWNYIWLDDGVKADGARWYQVDTTFASQHSIKEIDMNEYGYFLKGSGSDEFSPDNHQMPYSDFGQHESETVKEQLRDWYAQENISSVEDYEIPMSMLSSAVEETQHGFIIRRFTNYGVGKGEQIAYIYTDLNKSFLIAIDENGKVLLQEVEGFDYTGIDSKFDVILPYMIAGKEYRVGGADGTSFVNGTQVSGYAINIIGANNTVQSIPFKIEPRNMSNSSENYRERDIQVISSYTGKVITPEIYIVDGYDNVLEAGRDYTVSYYTDSSETTAAELKKMGSYWCDISFFGNYCGNYCFAFEIGKINLAKITRSAATFNYYPKPIRTFKTAADYYVGHMGGISVGEIKLVPNTDFTVSSSGGLNYGDSGTITLTGMQSSAYVTGGTKTTFNYSIGKKYDISYLDGKAICTKPVDYTGSPVYPSNTDGIDDYLEKGVDYKIGPYSNNTDAGEAKVTIQGIGGCTGTIEMVYAIQPISIAGVKLENVKISNGVITYTAKYGTRTLVKDKDFTEKCEKTSTGYKLTIKGKGNYTASYIVNISVSNQSSSDTTIPTTKVNVNKTLISKLTAKKKAIVVKWKRPKGKVSGYRIEYSLKKNFKGAKTINVKGAKKASYTIKKLKSKKVYYVRIRTYYQKGNVVYLSSWSKAKKIKVK